MEKRTKSNLGIVGEARLVAKLISDFNIVSAKVPQRFFAYDLITHNDKKLEVKTARPMWKKRTRNLVSGRKTYEWPVWEFRRNPKQLHEESSNVVVCIGFESEDMSKEPRWFIIPSAELKNKKIGKPREVWSISIDPKTKSQFWEWENRWDKITED